MSEVRQTWFDLIKSYLVELEYKFTQDRNFFSMPFTGKKGTIDVLLFVGDAPTSESSFIVATAWLPVLIKKSGRARALEFTNSQNVSLAIGNFEVHGDPGQVVFRIGIEAFSGCVEKEQVVAMVARALQAVQEVETEIFELAD